MTDLLIVYLSLFTAILLFIGGIIALWIQLNNLSDSVNPLINKVGELISEIEGNRLEKVERKEKEDILSNRQEFRYEKRLEKLGDHVAAYVSKWILNDYVWLEEFMSKNGVNYTGTVYGQRMKHFYTEKKLLAKETINYIDSKIDGEWYGKKVYLIIDSGTTMQHVFEEICSRIDKKVLNDKWENNVVIITNNLPGIQYMMRYGIEPTQDISSDLKVNCRLIPGQPLAIYSATVGEESQKYLTDLKDKSKGEDVVIVSLITGNYICREIIDGNKFAFLPVARGKGHLEIKNTMAAISDEIIIVSPLMKISKVGVDELNAANGFHVRPENADDKNRKKVKYMPIEIPTKKVMYFTTQRHARDLFYDFYKILESEMSELKHNDEIIDFKMVEFSIEEEVKNRNRSGVTDKDFEIELEIPHKELRRHYLENLDSNIWSS